MADNNITTTEELKKESAKVPGAEEARSSEEAPKKKKKIIFVSNPQNSKMGPNKPKSGTTAGRPAQGSQGAGTASSEILDYFGMEATEKVIYFTFVTTDTFVICKY